MPSAHHIPTFPPLRLLVDGADATPAPLTRDSLRSALAAAGRSRSIKIAHADGAAFAEWMPAIPLLQGWFIESLGTVQFWNPHRIDVGIPSPLYVRRWERFLAAIPNAIDDLRNHREATGAR